MRALDIRKDQDYHARPSHQQFGESPFSKHLREQASERQGEHEPTPAPAPPVLDISEEERNVVWGLMMTYAERYANRLAAWSQEEAIITDRLLNEATARLRSALGFEQGE